MFDYINTRPWRIISGSWGCHHWQPKKLEFGWKKNFLHFSFEAALVQHRLLFFTEIKPKNFPNGMFNECSCCLGFFNDIEKRLRPTIDETASKASASSKCLFGGKNVNFGSFLFFQKSMSFTQKFKVYDFTTDNIREHQLNRKAQYHWAPHCDHLFYNTIK